MKRSVYWKFSRASFPYIRRDFLAEDTHSTVRKEKVGVLQRTGVVPKRRGVDTVDIGNGSCRVSRPKRKKKRRHPDSRLHMLPTTTLFARGV